MKTARNWTLAFLGTVVAVVVCYVWLDRPIALMVHAEFHEYDLFEKLTLIPTAIIPLAVVALVARPRRDQVKPPAATATTATTASTLIRFRDNTPSTLEPPPPKRHRIFHGCIADLPVANS